MDIDPESVCLRQLFPEDVTQRYVNWLNDPEVTRFLEIRYAKQPFTIESVKEFVSGCLKNHRHHWGIFVGDRHVGNISCSAYNYKHRWVDVSNVIGEKNYWGTILAKICLAGVLDYLFTVGDFHRVQAGTYSIHMSGIALLTNLGFRKEAVFKETALFNDKYIDVFEFGLLKGEWMKRNSKLPRVIVLRVPWEH